MKKMKNGLSKLLLLSSSFALLLGAVSCGEDEVAQIFEPTLALTVNNSPVSGSINATEGDIIKFTISAASGNGLTSVKLNGTVIESIASSEKAVSIDYDYTVTEGTVELSFELIDDAQKSSTSSVTVIGVAKIELVAGPVAIVNPGFEEPSGIKVQDDMSQIPGWSCDDVVINSGLEPEDRAPEGGQWGFIFNGEISPSMYNTTPHLIAGTETITLTYDIRNLWMTTEYMVTLYYLFGTERVEIARKVYTPDEGVDSGDNVLGEQIVLSTTDLPEEAIGKAVGIEVFNTTPSLANGGRNSWVSFDNFRMDISL